MKTITNFKIHMDLPPKAKKGDIVAFDSEFFGMDSNKLHRPGHGTFACVTCTYDGKNVYVVTDPTDLKEFFKLIDAGTWVLQNAKFDITHLRQFARIVPRSNLWDTMLVEQVMYSGYYNDFGLEDLARRHLGVYMSKEVRKQFSESTKLTKEQIEYACVDTIVTWLVQKEQAKVIDKKCKFVWENIDLPALWVVLGIGGVRLNTEKWIAMAKENKKQAESIQKRYKNINLNAPEQVRQHFIKLGYKKIKSTNKDFLRKERDNCKFAKDVMDFRMFATRVSRYGESFIEKNMESDGKLYGDWRVIGTETGRFSCSSPNLQNIPKRGAKEFRECFIADEGSVFVVGDWSAQEPRVATYFSGDEKLLQIFKKKKDIYISVAHEMGYEITKKDKERNLIFKPVTLGASYGLTEHGLEEKYDIPEDIGRKHLEGFFENFPTFAKWKSNQQRTTEPFVETIYGRRFWLNRYTNGWDRNAINSPIQGSGGDVIKITSARFVKEWHGPNYGGLTVIRLLVHDEIVIEVSKKEAYKAARLLGKIMVEEAEKMHKGVPAEADPYISPIWTEMEG